MRLWQYPWWTRDSKGPFAKTSVDFGGWDGRGCHVNNVNLQPCRGIAVSNAHITVGEGSTATYKV